MFFFVLCLPVLGENNVMQNQKKSKLNHNKSTEERTNERTIPVEATKYTSLANFSSHAVLCVQHISKRLSGLLAMCLLFILGCWCFACYVNSVAYTRARNHLSVLPIAFYVQFQWRIVCFWSTRLIFSSFLLAWCRFVCQLVAFHRECSMAGLEQAPKIHILYNSTVCFG